MAACTEHTNVHTWSPDLTRCTVCGCVGPAEQPVDAQSSTAPSAQDVEEVSVSPDLNWNAAHDATLARELVPPHARETEPELPESRDADEASLNAFEALADAPTPSEPPPARRSRRPAKL